MNIVIQLPPLSLHLRVQSPVTQCVAKAGVKKLVFPILRGKRVAKTANSIV